MRLDPKFYAGHGLDAMSINKLQTTSVEDLVAEIYAKTRPITLNQTKKDPIMEMMELLYEKRIKTLEDEVARLDNDIALLRDFINELSKK